MTSSCSPRRSPSAARTSARAASCAPSAAQPPYATLTFHCVATLSLERGQITLQGLVEFQGEDDPGPWTVAITGGTGRYRGASGQAVVRDVSDTITVYRLRLDAGRKKR